MMRLKRVPIMYHSASSVLLLNLKIALAAMITAREPNASLTGKMHAALIRKRRNIRDLSEAPIIAPPWNSSSDCF